MKNNTQMTLAGLGKVVIAIAAILIAGLAQIPSATAHPCSSNNHSGCDGHHCPGAGHNHITHHGRGHYCDTMTGVGAIYGPTNEIDELGLSYAD